VRAIHGGGQILEREVHAEGDAAAVQREAILLAGNLARDEARELIDELVARKPSPPPLPPEVTAEAPPKEPPAEAPPPEERVIATFSFFHPLATNPRNPDVRTNIGISLLYERIGYLDGLGLGMGVSFAKRGMRGSHLTIGATIAGGDVDGYQGSVGANLALGRLRGAQMAAGMNLVKGDAAGIQMSAGANIALAQLTGAQLSLINIGGDIEGAQVGLVNIARHVKGAQVGLVNIAQKQVEGAAIGLASIAPDAVHPIFWSSNLAYTNVGIKFSTKYAYTLLAVGFGTNEVKLTDGHPLFVGAVGAHLPIASGLDLDLETAYSDLAFETDNQKNRAVHVRALPGYSFAKHLRLFAGGGARIPVAFDVGSPAVRPEGVVGVQF
jgi:hypothetical protein